jgi:hypothetical protein
MDSMDALVWAVLIGVVAVAVTLGVFLRARNLVLVLTTLSTLWLWYGWQRAGELSGTNFYGMLAGAISMNLLFVGFAFLASILTWFVKRYRRKDNATEEGR